MTRKPVTSGYLAGALLLVAAVLTSAIAGQPGPDLTLSEGMLSPVPSAEAGKAPVVPPNAVPFQSREERCVPGLPCGTRLMGTVRKNGAVELQMPAWRW